MRLRFLAILFLITTTIAQDSAKPQPKSVTVPFILDQNRIVIDMNIQLPDGSTERVPAWLDNGNSQLVIAERLTRSMKLTLVCAGQVCGAPFQTPQITIGGMKLSFSGLNARVTQEPEHTDSTAFPGMNVGMNIPSTVLRNYDILIDFPARQLTIAQPGTLKFKGVKTKAIVNAQGLIEIPSQIENKRYNLGLDLGSSVTSLSPELFDKLSAAHPTWPHMTGAIGPANQWGDEAETTEELMRVDRLQYGPLFLTNVAAEKLQNVTTPFRSQIDASASGVVGAEALLNYRVGLDYARSAVYFDIGRMVNFPDFDVVGLILRPEFDGTFTVAAIADYDGKSSVPEVQIGDRLVAVDDNPVRGATMGQAWALLGGEPGKQHALTLERSGKQLIVNANVKHFLAEPDDTNFEGKSKKN